MLERLGCFDDVGYVVFCGGEGYGVDFFEGFERGRGGIGVFLEVGWSGGEGAILWVLMLACLEREETSTERAHLAGHLEDALWQMRW